jgi:predicted enzyme related to lactoylglutathione lyase
MPQKTDYEQGTPSWVDLQTTDQAAGKEFYASLLGWSYDDQPMPQGGTYSMALLKGETVAAIAPMPPGAPEGMPPMWNTYIAVDDVDATLEKVGPAGGQVLMPAMAVGDAGTMVNEPGALIWNELITDKPESALAFYEAVLGVSSGTMEMGPGETYHLLKVGETEVGGCMQPPMPDVPNHWHVYFAVPDADATAAQASSAGGQIAVEPFDIPTVGRSAVLMDPQGAMFSVLTPAAQQ